MIGTTLAHYRITAALGAGGMGEVWRATDEKLGREVALKVLPEAFASDPNRLARFEREAKVLASLNHPNIAHLYGLESVSTQVAAGTAAPQGSQADEERLVGHASRVPARNSKFKTQNPTLTSDAGASEVTFLVMELVEGEDLSARISRGPIPVDEAIPIALQIAEALEAAHEAGIVHRDLKPANIKLTDEGVIKVLDFGLAKAWEAEGGDANSSLSPTLTRHATIEGVILGTAAYMSPEQARGKPVDKRADIWAFGVVLWEMLTGRRLFSGETVSDVLAAVLKNEPEWIALPKNVGPATRRLLERCLEKNPRRRYRDIGDVALDLVAGPAADIELGAAPSGAGRAAGRLAWATACVAIAVAIALGVLLWRQLNTRPSPPRFEKLTFTPQWVTNARFAPDGRTVVFSTALQGNTSELFVRDPGDPKPRRLGGANVQLLSVSSTGELAVLTRTRFRSHRSYIGTLARMPLAEASPREILNDVTAADWSPDGSELAIIREVSGSSRLEYPIGKVLAESKGYLSDVRISPKGDLIAFMYHAFEWDDRGPVVVVDRSGAVVAKTPEYPWEEGLAWTADGESVLFGASDKDAIRSVRELSLDGTIRDVLSDSTGLSICDMTADGRLLVTTSNQRASIVARFPGASAERTLPSFERTFFPVMSRDGRSLIFTDQSRLAGPYYSVYLQPADDSPPVRLGEGVGADLSPDGTLVAVVVMSEPPRLMVYPTGAGEPRDISVAGFASYDYASMRFLEDGRGVAFCGSETGKASRCYIRDLDGGAARSITPEGTDHGLVSPDGTTVVARDTDGLYQLYPQDGSEPTPVPGLVDGDYLVNWGADDRSLLIYRPMEIPSRIERLDLSTGRKTLVRELAPAELVGAQAVYGVSVSADEKSYAYALERAVGALYVIEGVR